MDLDWLGLTGRDDYCDLCGLHLGPSSSVEELPWECKVRALYVDAAQGHPRVTGVGRLENHQVHADLDPDVAFDHPTATLTLHPLRSDPYRMRREAPTVPALGLHDACWSLLVARISQPASNESPAVADVAAQLYAVLKTLPVDRYRALDPMRDYGGRWTRLDDPRIDRVNDAELEEEQWALVSADPRRISVDDVVPPPWPATTQQGWIQDADNPNGSDVFARGPAEIILAILTELPSVDVCSLRLASPAVAAVSSRASLPQTFWCSRFARGFEMAFYTAGDLQPLDSRHRDWRALYLRVRHCLKNPSAYPSICNRRRIWNVLGDLSDTLEALLLSGSPAMQPPTNIVEKPPSSQGMSVRVCRPPQSNPACPTATIPFTWDIGTPATPYGMTPGASIKISTSFIQFDRQTYLCGMRATVSSPAATFTLSNVGLVNPLTEQHIYLGQCQKITAVRVACSHAGVVGIKFLACKCISVSILDRHTPAEQKSPIAASPIWFPDIPKDFQFPPPADQLSWKPHEQVSKNCLNMDFGGPAGERLCLLNRVTPFLNNQGLLQGMAFFYDDGTELVFGSRREYRLTGDSVACVEPSFLICGAAGERILSIDYKVTYRSWETMDNTHGPCFQIKTNMGFQSTFGVHGQKQWMFEGMASVGCLGFPMTSLFAEMSDFSGHVSRLEARYIYPKTNMLPSESPHPVAISRENLNAASHVYHGLNLACASGVHLGKVRSISFSTGNDGYCRSRDNLCGMLVRFWGTDRSLILGHWIREAKDAFIELQHREKLTEISICYTPQEPNAAFSSGSKTGRVVGVRLTTSEGQKKEFGLFEAKGKILVKHIDNTLEEITGLVWTFNSRCEKIQVLRTPPRKHSGTELVSVGRPTPRLVVPGRGSEARAYYGERLLWQETEHQTGKSCRVVAIDAFCYHCPNIPYRSHRFGLVGLRFRYTGGLEREVGCCTIDDTVMMESMELGDDVVTHFERIREGSRDVDRSLHDRQDLGLNDERDEDEREPLHGVRIAFHFASGRAVKLPGGAGAVGADGARRQFVVAKKVKQLDDDAALLKGGKPDYYVPLHQWRSCVGLWVQMRQSGVLDWVEDVGPLFQCKVVEE